MYVHMYAAYDIRRPICDGEFSKPSHLCFAVHMSPICDGLGPKKIGSQVKLDVCLQNIEKVRKKFAIANRTSGVVSRIHVYIHLGV